jgi:hypothetical protein
MAGRQWTMAKSIEPPTITHLRAMGLTGLSITCDKAGCQLTPRLATSINQSYDASLSSGHFAKIT